MEIPYSSLSEDALRGLIEEFVSREGTDYGHSEHSFEDKVRAVMAQLKRGEARITFDPESETCTLEPAR